MDYNPVGWFEIYVQDMDRARKFYETVLGTKLEKLDAPEQCAMEDQLEMYGFSMSPEGKGASGALCKMKDCPSGGAAVIVYFTCQDCAVEESRVKAAGGDIHKSKLSIGKYGFISLVVDTEGNMIGLHSQK